jgi:hypothetical protein
VDRAPRVRSEQLRLFEEFSSMSSDSRARVTGPALIIAALVTLLLVVIGARQFIGYDSLRHVFIARQDRWPDFWREIVDNAHPPLYYLFLRATMRALGHSFLAYRSISILSIAACTVLVAKIVVRVTGNTPMALLAAAAFGFSFSAVDVGLEVRSYALCLAFALATFILYLDWIDADAVTLPAWKRWTFATMLTAAVMTHYSSGFFLAGVTSVPVVLFSCHRRWRRRLANEIRDHTTSAVAMFAVPWLVMALAYLIHVRWWTGRLNHVLEFIYHPATESVHAFVVRTTEALSGQFFPGTGFQGPIVALVMISVVIVLLALTAREEIKREIAAVPVLLLVSMVFLNLGAGLAGRYPYGGERRHEIILFPFLIIALFAGLECIRRAVPSGWASVRVWAGATAFVVAVSVASWLSAFRVVTSPLMRSQMLVFHANVGEPPALLADEFNFTMVFGQYQDWTWRLHWQDPEKRLWQVWDVTRGDQHVKVCRDREWQVDLSRPEFYRDVGDCLARSEADRVGVFRLGQDVSAAAGDSGDLAAAALAFGGRVGLSADTLLVQGVDIYASFRRGAPARRIAAPTKDQ